MSELTRCNFCSHRRSVRQARTEGKVITVLPSDFGLGGVAEYKHPPDVDVRKLSKEERKQYDNGVWYMQLTDHCCC